MCVVARRYAQPVHQKENESVGMAPGRGGWSTAAGRAATLMAGTFNRWPADYGQPSLRAGEPHRSQKSLEFILTAP